LGLILVSVVISFSFIFDATSRIKINKEEKNFQGNVLKFQYFLNRKGKKSVEYYNFIVVNKPVYTIKKVDFFHYILIKKYNKVVAFNSNNEKISVLGEKTIVVVKKNFAWYKILAVLGICIVCVSYYSKYNIMDTSEFTFIFFVVAGIITIIISTITIFTLTNIPISSVVISVTMSIFVIANAIIFAAMRITKFTTKKRDVFLFNSLCMCYSSIMIVSVML
jgi:hypothetical protein